MRYRALLTLAFVTLAAALVLYAGVNLTVSMAFDPLSDVSCNGDGTANATVHYTVSSQAAAAADGYYTVNGGAQQTLPLIAGGLTTDTPPGDWTAGSGGTKTYGGSFTINNLATPGTYTVETCFEQPGAHGANSGMFDCDTTTIVLAAVCTQPDTCDRAGVFGEVVGNKNLCKSGGTINFQFKGLFGSSVPVTIVGPLGTVSGGPFTVYRNGDSCVYNLSIKPSDYSLDTVAAAGNYTFTVGNGTVIPPDVEYLSCSKR